MVTNDPTAMSFLLMNALVCVVMLDIIVNICALCQDSASVCCLLDGGGGCAVHQELFLFLL